MTLGRDPECDLVIDHPSVAPRHAEVELNREGAIQVTSLGAHAVIRLERQSRRVQVQRAVLCVVDRLFVGEQEVPLARVSGLFGLQTGALLRPRPAAAPLVRTARTTEQPAGQGSPRRNPTTGKIEN